MYESQSNSRFVILGVVAVVVVVGIILVVLWSQKEKTPQRVGVSEDVVSRAEPVVQEDLVKGVYKDSVLRSTDGGNTFETFFTIATSSAVGTADVLSITFHPLVKDNVETNGRILHTDNGGKSWRAAYAEPGEGTYVSALAQHPKKFNEIFAGTNRGTIVKSIDGGDTWINVGQKVDGTISTFTFDSTKGLFVYLLSYQKKIHHSVDGGTTWLNWEEEKAKEVKELNDQASAAIKNGDKETGNQLREEASALATRNRENKAPAGTVFILADPFKSGLIYAGTTNGLYRSTDYGKYWYNMNIIESALSFPINSIAINPKNPNEISFVAGKTYYRSTNSGNTWATVPLDNSRKASFVAYDPFDTKTIFVGMSGK
jgi:photosystem II stability/assembly factor-like uncharacterized protein